MKAFWVVLLETEVILALGYWEAIQMESEPQPQPRSRISRPGG